MRRRDLIALAAVIALPAAAGGEHTPPIVALLAAGSPAGHEKQLEEFRNGLATRGYRDGSNVAVEYRWAGDDYARLAILAAELVRSRAAVIVASNLPAARAAANATKTIPIVFLIGDDPIKHGLATSLNHPGGNATGVSMLAVGLVTKRLQLLRDLVPGALLVAVLVNRRNPNVETELTEIREASTAMGQRVEVFEADTMTEIEAAFATAVQRGAKALVVGPDPSFNNQRVAIVALAARYAIPGIYEWREFAEAGGLASYGPNLNDSFRQMGAYTGRILAGAKPADLPVVQPTKFELVINLKTAKTLGLSVPQLLLAQADEVIE